MNTVFLAWDWCLWTPIYQQLRFWLTISPGLESTLSAGTDVATVLRYFSATLLNIGNALSFFFSTKAKTLHSWGWLSLPCISAFQCMYMSLLYNCSEKPKPESQTPAAVLPGKLNRVVNCEQFQHKTLE